MSYQLLLVEDDCKIQEAIYDYLTDKSGGELEITRAVNARQAEEALCEEDFDLILLDIMLPDGDGFSLCRLIRSKSDAPVIFLTARGREEDKLYGYELGCDDYLVKPFSLAELYAKVRALLKRAKGTVLTPLLQVGGICLNPRKMTVTAEGREVNLTPKLYLLLQYLMEHRQSVVSRETLLILIWGYDFDGNERVVDNHIKKLRKALGSCGSQIKTVITRGYRLDEK